MLKVFCIAGEESGDIHAYNMFRELNKLTEFFLYGTGGERLKSLGQEQYFNTNDMTIIGFSEVIKRLPFILNMKRMLINKLKEVNPDIVLLVDYPGFNLNFAKSAKELGFKVYYYIAPQIWAWHYSRVEKIKKYVDKIFCILPFEEKIFLDEMVDAKYVGNPIFDNLNFHFNSKEEFLLSVNLDNTVNKKIIAVLPGSRKREVVSLMPIIIESFKKFSKEYIFIIAKADSVEYSDVDVTGIENVIVVEKMTYDTIKYSDLVWVCSGTASLETAIIGKPMIIMYKVSKFNEILGKMLIRVPYIGLPNIILNRKAFPEILQGELTADNIYSNSINILEKYDDFVNSVSEIGAMFQGKSPSISVAEEIYSLIGKKSLHQ